jgi:hypothetical protein
MTFSITEEDGGERFFAVSVTELKKLNGFSVPIYRNGDEELN